MRTLPVILDNIVFSLQNVGGISNVWYELLKKILIDKNIKCRFIEYNGSQSNLYRQQLCIHNSSILKHYSFSIKMTRFFNVHFMYDKPFIFHSSSYRTCTNKNAINIITVHDFIDEHLGHGLKKHLNCIRKYKAIRDSDYVICISENTKKDLLNYLPDVDPQKLIVIYNGVSDEFHILKNHKYEFDINKYILYIGSRAEYKNFRFIVNCLSKTDFNFVICGKPLNSEEKEYIDTKLNKNQYFLYTNVSTKHLNELYNKAYCLAYPSSYEGFGIPVIEAQRAGCPVIAMNASSISEIIGNTPLLINELSTSEFLLRLDILNNNNVRDKIIADGIENSKKYSWDKMGNEYINLYKNVLNSHENIFNNCIIQQRSND